MITPKKERGEFSIKNTDNNKVFGNKQESVVAKKLGARQTPNSGSTPFLKTDMLIQDSAIDVKSSKSNQIIVDVKMLKKLETDAVRVGKEPVLLLNFPRGDILKNKMWLLIPYNK